MIKDIYNKNPLLILSYISKKKRDVYGSQIATEIGVNQGYASVLLKTFEEMGIVNKESKGKTILFNVNNGNALVKAFRVFDNLVEINSLIQEIKAHSKKIQLFGSCACGEDGYDSDIDLLIVAFESEKETIYSKIRNFEIDRKISPVIVDPLELIEMDKSDKAFLNEVEKGIILWECEA
jgi:predicted nucleotidyltransferase